MITFDHVTFTYAGTSAAAHARGQAGTSAAARAGGEAAPALDDVSLHVPEGELCLVVGPTGSGKSSLLRAVNGLVPWFSGGTLSGTVTVAGRSTADHPPREMADLVGYVAQAPAAGFVAELVEDELAYTMENLGVPAHTMRRRVEEVIDLLGLERVRRRALADISSGEQQRVAIASVLASAPRVLVLDEPTSALDPGAAEEVLAAVTRLVHDIGLTVLMAEHRLERVVQYADRVAVIDGGAVRAGLPETMLADSPVAPPVVELGRLAGWSPLPLSVRDARRVAGRLHTRLGEPAPRGSHPSHELHGSPVSNGGRTPDGGRPAADAAPVVDVRRLQVNYGSTCALAGVSLEVGAGEVVAVMGRNGAGKSTLLGCLSGLRPPSAGRVAIGGDEPHRLAPRALVERVALVPSDPGLLLYAASVREECRLADEDAGLASGTTAASMDAVLPGVDPERHPRDLSEGERLALALGVVLAPAPLVVALDEPTRGLDYAAKRALVALVATLARGGRTVVLATHDVELVADVATRVVILADGEVVADGPARDVVTGSPMFAPQVAKIMAPSPWLNLTEVREALGVGT